MSMADTLDPYALFGLNEHHANLQTARASYYALALETHPDKHAGNAEQFKVVHAAWKWVEQQMEGVPDACEVVSRFEAHRDEWQAFLAQQTAEDLPSLRTVHNENNLSSFGTTSNVMANSWVYTSVAPQWRNTWNEAAAKNFEVGWPAFPTRGYGSLMGNASTSQPQAFPTRELVVYEAPNPAPDRLSIRLTDPQGVSDLDDFSVADAEPFGCDYLKALTPCATESKENLEALCAVSGGTWTSSIGPPDPRVFRTVNLPESLKERETTAF